MALVRAVRSGRARDRVYRLVCLDRLWHCRPHRHRSSAQEPVPADLRQPADVGRPGQHQPRCVARHDIGLDGHRLRCDEMADTRVLEASTVFAAGTSRGGACGNSTPSPTLYRDATHVLIGNARSRHWLPRCFDAAAPARHRNTDARSDRPNIGRDESTSRPSVGMSKSPRRRRYSDPARGGRALDVSRTHHSEDLIQTGTERIV